MNIIIPLCGKGIRFKATHDKPKPLINIFNKEMIFYVLDNLNINKEDKIFIIYHKELNNFDFKNILLQKYKDINFIQLNNDTTGAADTIYKGLQIIFQNFNFTDKTILLDCDTFYTVDILNMYRNEDNNCVFYVNNTDINPIYSYIELDNDKKITRIIEKQKISNNANTGCYCFNDIKQLYKYSKYVSENNITFNNETYISCIIHTMILDDIKFVGIELDNNNIYSLGTPQAVNKYIDNTYAFLFDLDGTIVLTDMIYKKVWSDILKEYNIDYTDEIFIKYIKGFNDYTVISTLLKNININEKILSHKKDMLFIEYINEIKIIDGFINFIIKLKEQGYKICIVTNSNRIVAEKILDIININKYIDFLIIGNECEKPKPYPEPYMKAMEKLNIQNTKSIIFEDSNTGILSAVSSNPKCIIGIKNKYNNNEDVNYSQCNFIIDNYNELNIKDIIDFNFNQFNKLKDYIINSNNDINIKDIVFLNNKLKGGFISDVLGVKIITDNNNIDCVVKIKNPNLTPLQIMAEKLNLYERENYFYESISKYIPIKIPKYYGLIKNNNFENIGVMLENMNLRKEKFILNLDLNTSPIETSLNVIKSIAKLHSKFWGLQLDNSFKELKKNNDNLFMPGWGNFLREKLPLFVNKWSNIFNIKFINNIEKIVNNFEEIQEHLSNKNLTLIHGDVKSPNIFYMQPNNEPYFIDWQYIAHGKGVQDLVFFMIESFEINKINIYGNMFREYYYIQLLESGVINYKYDEYIKDFNYAAMYFPIFVAIWFGTTPVEDLIDKNFPYFYLLKLSNFLEKYNIDL